MSAWTPPCNCGGGLRGDGISPPTLSPFVSQNPLQVVGPQAQNQNASTAQWGAMIPQQAQGLFATLMQYKWWLLGGAVALFFFARRKA